MNLVLITSVINTPKTPLSYSSIRSVYTRDERFDQTKKTIKSIKEKIPNCKIMIVECTDFTEDEKQYFDIECDYILNLFNNIELCKNIFGLSKSLGEGTMTIEALKYIIDNNLEYDNLFKISGRYWLSENFNYNNFKNNNIVFKKINGDINNIFTALYKTVLLYNFLLNNIINMKNKIGYEVLFGYFLHCQNYIDILLYDPIGLAGNVTVCGSIYNG